MKIFFKSSLIFSVLFIFIFNFSSDAQIRDTRLTEPVLDGMFTIKQGWVCYNNNSNIQESNNLMCQMKVNLRDNNYYKIHSVKLNEKKCTFQNHDTYGGKYDLLISPYNCQVGQTFELIATLVRKDSNYRQVPIIVKIVKLATYRVNNLIKEFNFPAPGHLVSLDPILDPSLTFKWKFTGSPQKTMLRVVQVLGNEVSRKEQSVAYRKIPKSRFEPDKDYRIRLGAYPYGDPKNNFTFTKAVARGSRLTFSNELYSKFKTSK